jgi:hypothetical protein
MAVKIGPVSAKFNGKIRLSDMNPPQSYTLNFDGQGGAAGFGKGSAKVALTPNDGGCELGYTVHAQVGGKVAQLGQRLVDGAAKSMAEDFFKRFDDEMQRRYPAASGTGGRLRYLPHRPAAAQWRQRHVPTWVWIAGAVVLAAWSGVR